MASKADIYNLALSLLGVPSISDPAGSGTAAIVTSVYDTCRLSLLEQHPWNFAIKRAALAQLVDAPSFEFAYQYQLPADYVRLLKIYDASSKWAEEGGVILSDDSTVNIWYVADITDINAFTPTFRSLLAHSIASSIGYKFTQNNGLIQQIKADEEKLLLRAKVIDGQKTVSSKLFSNYVTQVMDTPYGLIDE